MEPLINPIKAARLALGWTQQDLAAYALSSVQTVVHTERGLYQNPPPALLRPLVAPHTDAASAQALTDAYHAHQQQIRLRWKAELIAREADHDFNYYVINRGRLYRVAMMGQFDWRLLSNYYHRRSSRGPVGQTFEAAVGPEQAALIMELD